MSPRDEAAVASHCLADQWFNGQRVCIGFALSSYAVDTLLTALRGMPSHVFVTSDPNAGRSKSDLPHLSTPVQVSTAMQWMTRSPIRVNRALASLVPVSGDVAEKCRHTTKRPSANECTRPTGGFSQSAIQVMMPDQIVPTTAAEKNLVSIRFATTA
jgi:hypothetical protein